ncbi:schlafen family member 11-like [Emys orbicularis]|uniref:schlafen family member 11-like n=1 Tax=Emys orbicularis TaxID=82168 RepID=UPI0031FD79BA
MPYMSYGPPTLQEEVGQEEAGQRHRMAMEEEHPCVDLNTNYPDVVVKVGKVIFDLAEVLKTELSVSGASPLSKTVFSNKGLTCLSDLRKSLFPMYSNRITYTPEILTKGLFSEYPGLENLMNKQMEDFQGLLIFSRSWAFDVGLQKDQHVVCDALLIATGKHPTLYTVTEKDCSVNMFEYARQTARALKQKLVNVGGYTQRVCVIPHLLQLGTNEEGNTELGLQVKYPASYNVSQKDITKLLNSLVIILLGFRSFLSDSLGCEFFNLLTVKQYEILSKDLHKCRKLFIYGLPGTGKTIVALKIIEKIRHMFCCHSDEILYICENQPLKEFVRGKGICQSVTRVTFMSKNFEKVKHIVVDEAQNFRAEDGLWYSKAEDITQSHNEPGVFWIFLDYLQTSHPYKSGLPPARQHDPVESLTKVIRNSREIYGNIKRQMERIVQDEKLGDVPYVHLKNMLRKATCGHNVSGDYTIKRNLNMKEIANDVARQCFSYLQNGYSEKDIAILCRTDKDTTKYEDILKREMRKFKLNIVFQAADEIQGKHITLDSIRRFSGLKRSIVFGVNPVPTQKEISDNLLLCVASRANLHLHLLFEKIPSGYSGGPQGHGAGLFPELRGARGNTGVAIPQARSKAPTGRIRPVGHTKMVEPALGLPHPSEQYPQEWLIKRVRNATQIYAVMAQEMETIVRNQQIDIPHQRLRMLLDEAECAHPLSGVSKVERNLEEDEIVTYMVENCLQYFQNGYSGKDIAILYSTVKKKDKYRHVLQPKMENEMKNFKLDADFTTADDVLGYGIVLDSIRHFSGLERSFVFGINPVPTQEEISNNLLLCVASRANLQLHLLYGRAQSTKKLTVVHSQTD